LCLSGTDIVSLIGNILGFAKEIRRTFFIDQKAMFSNLDWKRIGCV
jgi:hypothetical protein